MVLFRAGSSYLAGLRDGRSVVMDGAAIEDVPSHPAFCGCAQTIAQLIDIHGREARDLTYGSGEKDRRYALCYLPPERIEDVGRRGAYFREMAAATGGLLARSPDFLASLLSAWHAASAVFGRREPRYARNVVNYYEASRNRHLCHTHAISDPPPDRFLARKVKPLTLSKVRETSEGIVVRGIKMLATLSPIADELLVYPFRPLGELDQAQALAFAVPIATKGLKLLCRAALASGHSAFDRPLSERFDEMDALCIFDDVLVPHDRVFIDGDVQLANTLREETGMTAYLWHQTAARVAAKAEMMLGTASLLARLSGRDQQEGVRELLGELAASAETLRALVVAAEVGARQDRFGMYVPDGTPLGASTVIAPQAYARAVEILQLVGASGLVMHPSAADLEGSDGSIEHYFAASDEEPRVHVQVLKHASELAVSSFGGRQVLYERFYLGAPRALQARFYQSYPRTAPAEARVRSLLEAVNTRAPSPTPKR
jgi:4-hydroxyphenylacetate 3-monooxygenase oxygenase component